MTTVPFPLNGIVYDIDNTVEGGVTVKITNTRTGDTQDQTTNSSGEYAFDLANFTNEYETNDIILIQAWKDDTLFKLMSSSILVEGSSVTKNLTLRPVFNKIIKQSDLKEIQVNEYAEEFGAKNIIEIEAERIDITRNINNYATSIVEYINGVKKTTTITRDSNDYATKIEVS